jgi:hypothetical protein
MKKQLIPSPIFVREFHNNIFRMLETYYSIRLLHFYLLH